MPNYMVLISIFAESLCMNSVNPHDPNIIIE